MCVSVNSGGNALAFDDNDQLFAGQTENPGTIGRIEDCPNGTYTVIADNLARPARLAFGTGTPFGDDIFVTEFESGVVSTVNETTGAATDFATGFLSPFGLAFDGTEALYVAESGLGRIIRIFSDEPCCNEPPVAQCTDVTRECVAGQTEDVSVDNGSYDPDGDPITLTQNPTPAYNLFPPGMFDVELTVTDDSGESDTCTGTLTIEDTVTPAVSCPNDIIAECTESSGTPVAYDVTALDQCDGDLVPVCTPASGTTFSLGGASPVTCSATDASGKTAQCGFTVTVQDTTAPTLVAPPDVRAQCAAAEGTPVALGTPTVTDACDGSPTIGNDAPAVFPLGTSIVTWTATDSSGNEVTAAQEVTVVEPCGINCDINGNGTFDWRDTVRFAIGCRKGSATWTCDLNEDGRFNWRDTVLFVKKCRAKR